MENNTNIRVDPRKDWADTTVIVNNDNIDPAKVWEDNKDKNETINADLLKELEDLKQFKANAEKEKKDSEMAKLISEWKIEEAYKNKLESLENILKEKENEVLNTYKDNLFTKYKIPDTLQKFVTWSNKEELEANIKEIASELEKNWVIWKKRDILNNLDGKKPDGNDKGSRSGITRESIKNMTPKEYLEKKDEINKLLLEGKL